MIRSFVVGCPRSGTTYIQSLIVSCTLMISAPETHYFEDYADGSRLDRLRMLGPQRYRRRLPTKEALESIGLPSSNGTQSHRWSRSTRAFVRHMDSRAQDCGAAGWIEKTPGHFRSLRLLRREIPGCRFVYVVRDGLATVASLLDVTRSYPKQWNGPRTVQECVDEWNRATRIAKRNYGRSDVLVISYEHALADPESTYCKFLSFLGLPSSAFTFAPARDIESLIRSDEEWKSNNTKPGFSPRYFPVAKLTTCERQYIARSLVSIQDQLFD